MTMVAIGEAEEGRLRNLDRVIRDEVEATIGWQEMSAEVLVRVRANRHRRRIAMAQLARVLGALHRSGIPTASADVDESSGAALALFDGVGARRASSNLELVLH
ncbi:hypothetical protein [Amycolatopsis sp. NPDC051128]|uniref:hypothetical protein n=1 Tax=Amycolatopsis sp. NPDC051128 TaxID=3155412 RepID=UPI0034134B9F